MALLPLADAQAHVLERVSPLPVEDRPLGSAAGHVLAADVGSTVLLPPFDNTAMDGFAVRAADTAGAPVTLAVVGTVAAGAASLPEVGPGQAARIMTGAPIPPGADAVVMVERTSPGPGDGTVVIEAPAQVGDHVRRAGDDVRPGARVLAAGTWLGPGAVGLLASLGADTVAVHRRPRVGVLSTGDELVTGSRPLRPGEIRDSNRPSLLAAVSLAGCDGHDLGHVRDDPDEIAAAMARGAAECDAVLTSGGVSVGDFDHVKVVLDRLGDMRWMQIAIKPAKPFAFGLVEGVPFFGLPGNPVSSVVSFELLARPGLRKLAGLPPDRWHRAPRPAVLADPIERRPDGKTHYVRVTLRPRPATGAGPATGGGTGTGAGPATGGGTSAGVGVATGGGVAAGVALEARSAGGQGSHQLAALAAADGLAVVPDGDGLAAGAVVDVLPLVDL